VIEAARTWWLLRSLRAGSSTSPGALARGQARHLRFALDHAYRRVPFFRRVWDQAGFDPGSVRGIEEIERVPIVTQPMVREAAARGELIADDVDPARIATYTTAGSTGEPMHVPRLTLEHRLIRAGGLRIWFEHGYRWRHTAAHIDAERGRHHRLRRLGASRTRWIPGRSAPEEQLAALRATRPHLVMGTPTVLRRICGAIEAEGAGDVTPQVVLCGGEVLDAATRAVIERALGVAPVEIYGLTEVGFVAWQCERRQALHLSAETCLTEVRREGRAARSGELGTLVLTDLRSRTMPLIRYDSADLAALVAERRLEEAPETDPVSSQISRGLASAQPTG
jgi:phenylacetate-CoA ligase